MSPATRGNPSRERGKFLLAFKMMKESAIESQLPRFNSGGFDDTCGVFTLAHDKVRDWPPSSGGSLKFPAEKILAGI